MRILQVFAVAAIVTGAAWAQDPPSRVARLNWTEGAVSFQPAGVDTWTQATLNYPLTTGDHIYTDSGARAEMHVGPNAVRLEHESNFGFLNLDDRTVQMRFGEGAMELRLRHLEDDDLYEIDTPNGAITLLRAGDYRIDADPGRNATMVTVYSGEADVLSGGISYQVHPRQTAYFTDNSQPDIREQNPDDDFDHFTAARNTREDRLPPPVHVSQSMVGYEDLDAYGAWRETPDYGWVWAPRVNVGWAPYRQGHWAWVDPWGWTWIDDAPWGFAPFHYGRWANAGGGWVWVPGAVVARPVYAPALVVFAGGAHFGAGLVAWFPLGPREVYRPAYVASPRYVQQVNVTHVTNINVTNVTYVNQRNIVAVPQGAFAGAHSVHQSVQQVDVSDVRAIGSAPNVAPQRESVLANARAGGPVAQPRGTMRPVVARTTPPPPPVRFEARQQALAANQGRPLAPEQINQIRQQSPQSVETRPAVRVVNTPNRPQPQQAPAATERPRDRFESRPPNAPQPAARPAFEPRPENRPEVAPRAPAAVRPPDRFESRPQQPAPVSRPVPEPRAEAPRAPAPPPAAAERREQRQERNEQRREERKAEKKEDKEKK